MTRTGPACGVRVDDPQAEPLLVAGYEGMKQEEETIPAASRGCLKEAAHQLARALREAEWLPPERRAELYERRSYECYLTDQISEAVAARTGHVSHEAGMGIITDVKQVGGYPEYRGEPALDSDGDGIPDWWERKYGLNPHDPADG